jgi:SAM-dependent methyltransferase
MKNYEQIVQDLIGEHTASPNDILGVGNTEGERRYLQMLRGSYVRTVSDVDRLCASFRTGGRLLEIGSYLGCVSFALKRVGYSVFALDIPEFHNSPKLRAAYDRHSVPFCGVNLRHGRLPYESESFDMVIMCEVIEHLNFNPLPTLMEINRVLKVGGYLYIGTPNQSRLANRLRAMAGRSFHNPIEDFFAQLGNSRNMLVGLHWREYTLGEMLEMLEKMGFEVTQRYFYQDWNHSSSANIFWRLGQRIASMIPSFRTFQVLVAKKKCTCDRKFTFTEANS